MIPIIINNRDLLTWTKAMVEKLQTLNDVSDIYIIDNASTYEPLLNWYKTKPCEIIYLDNLGHKAPWQSGFVERLNKPFYIVTDSDLGIDDLPNDAIEYMLNKLQHTPLLKLGLGLEWEYITSDSPYYNHLQTYEKSRWANSRIENGVYMDVHIDTTFAMYKIPAHFVGGGSLPRPYTAKHYPWEFTHEQRLQNDEFNYYVTHANDSSSYKILLKL